MGKKRSVVKSGGGLDSGKRQRFLGKLPKRKMVRGILYIHASYNNTRISLTDDNGDMVMWSTTGSLGFSGTKKSTPFAAAKVSELMVEKAQAIGIKEVAVIVKGIGPGREAALRTFMNKGLSVHTITDMTPIPHNGPRRRKMRRV